MRRAPHARGFSLIELLVAIGVIGLLLAIATPTLSRARAVAIESASLANCRTNWQAIEAWAGQQQDQYPRCVAGEFYGAPGWSGIGISSEVGAAWLTGAHWYSVIRSAAPFHEYRQVFLSPGADRADEGFMPSYLFSHSFVARPSLWTPTAATLSQAHLEALIDAPRRSHVTHPAGKAGLYDAERAYIPERFERTGWKTPMAFADGHAAAHRISEATPGFPNILNGDYDAALHNTPGGVQGRDY